MAHRVARRATDDLDEIWYYVATENGKRRDCQPPGRFHREPLLSSRHPHLGRRRDDDLGVGSRSFPVGEYVIVYCVENEDVLILRVVHGRDLEALFGG